MVRARVPGEPRARSVADLFLRRVAATPDREAFRYPTPSGEGWASLTWRQMGDRVRAVASGLRELGLEDGQRCGILSSTRLEWIIVDFGILCAGGATTTVYPSSTAEDTAFILSDSECAFVFAEDDQQVAKLRAKRAELPTVRHVVVMSGAPSEDGWVLTLADLEAKGRAREEASPGALEAVVARLKPDSLATLVYTSGTTGRPKGVELVHDCWLAEAEALQALDILSPDDLQYLWLPLSHVFGKALEVAQLAIGFPTAVDGRVDRISANLEAVRPTFVAAVPRIFEKVHAKIVTGAEQAGGIKRALFHWAVDRGGKVSRLRREGKEPTGLLAFEHKLADKLVFSKLRAKFGGRLRFFVSGSAPLSLGIAEFFHAAGILIVEGYGLTESSAANFVNLPDNHRLGSVGLPLPGIEVRIADDGEILLRGRAVMRGYHHLPEATGEVLDAEGWLHTGDIGHLDADGFLFITDRKKDLIKTSGGKYVAPQALEGRIKALCPYLSQVVVHGDRRKFISALVALDPEGSKSWAREHGLGSATPEAVAQDPRMRGLVQACIDQVNANLPPHERVRAFTILPHELTLEAGELTPSLKVKRKAVEAKYREVLDRMYEVAETRE